MLTALLALEILAASIGLVLGSIAEDSIHKALAIWGPTFFMRPLSLLFIALIYFVYMGGGAEPPPERAALLLNLAEIDALSAAGVRLLSYLGNGAFVAGVDPGALSPATVAAYGIGAASGGGAPPASARATRWRSSCCWRPWA